jgi:serine/threonine protein kinase
MIVLSNKRRGDLGRYIREHPGSLTWKNRLHILADLAEALIVIHRENYAHRDIHPGNILLEDDCNGCHLADLGLCGPVIKNEKAYGVLPYLAPEVMDRNNKFEPTIKSDIYALGIVMWVLVTDKIPYIDEDEDDYKQLQMRIMDGQRPLEVEGIPDEYNDLMKRCWSHNPNGRPNAEEVYRYAKSLLNMMYNNVLKLEDVFKPIVVETMNKKGVKKGVDESVKSCRLISQYSESLKVDFTKDKN